MRGTLRSACDAIRLTLLSLTLLLAGAIDAAAQADAEPSPQPVTLAPVVDTSGDPAGAEGPTTSEARDADAGPLGFWIGAGANAWVHVAREGGVRLDVGVPIVELPVGQLSLTLPFILAPYRVDTGTTKITNHWIHIAATVRWEFPVVERWGSLVLWADGGGGVFIDRYKETGGGGLPPYEDTTYFGVIRFATGATFVFPFGLYVTFQPVGVIGIVGHQSGEGFYELSTTVGYRFE